MLVFTLAFFVLLPLGAFGFELSRIHLASEQLRVATDAAALAAAATRCNLALSDPDNAEDKAIAVGMYVFKKNAVVGHLLDETTYGPRPPSLTPGKATLQFFFEPKKVRASSALGMDPAFGISSLPTQTLAVDAAASGIPMIDIVVALDTSHSMTQETEVFVVKRFMKDGKLKHKVQMRNKLGANEMNKKYSTGWPYIPQDLGAKSDTLFDPDLRVKNRDQPEAGQPPGNGEGTADCFTDMVADFPIGGNPFFAGLTDPDQKAAVMVEAMRGNLENPAVFASSKADTTLAGLITPRPGFQAEYHNQTKKHLPLFTEAVYEVVKFVDAMHDIADVHFGLTTFAGRASKEGFDSINWWNVSPKVKGAGKGIVKLPYLQLNPSSENYTEVRGQLVNDQMVPQFVPENGTDTGGAVRSALAMLNDNSKARKEAHKVILLVTDGMPRRSGPDYFPTYPLTMSPDSREAATRAAYNAAKACRQDHVPIFAIGFLHIWDKKERQEGRLVLKNMVKMAKHGSQYYESMDIPQLRDDLGTVARQLVRLVN